MRSIDDVAVAAEGYANASAHMVDCQAELSAAREGVRRAQEECNLKLTKFQHASESERAAWNKLTEVRGNAHQVKAS